MMDIFAGAGAILVGISLVGNAYALILRERYRGQAHLIRALRGDPELPEPAPLFPRLSRRK